MDALVADTTKLLRWALYTLVGLDIVLVLMTVLASSPGRRLPMAFAMVVVFGLFSAPFVWMWRKGIRNHRDMVVNGVVVDATVDKLTTRRMQQNPFHHVTLRFAGPAGGKCTGQFSMAGGPAGLEHGDTVEVVCNFSLDKKIIAVLTPRHGVQPGRWQRVS